MPGATRRMRNIHSIGGCQREPSRRAVAATSGALPRVSRGLLDGGRGLERLLEEEPMHGALRPPALIHIRGSSRSEPRLRRQLQSSGTSRPRYLRSPTTSLPVGHGGLALGASLVASRPRSDTNGLGSVQSGSTKRGKSRFLPRNSASLLLPSHHQRLRGLSSRYPLSMTTLSRNVAGKRNCLNTSRWGCYDLSYGRVLPALGLAASLRGGPLAPAPARAGYQVTGA